LLAGGIPFVFEIFFVQEREDCLIHLFLPTVLEVQTSRNHLKWLKNICNKFSLWGKESICCCTKQKICKGNNTSKGHYHTFGKALCISCRRRRDEENEKMNQREEASLVHMPSDW